MFLQIVKMSTTSDPRSLTFAVFYLFLIIYISTIGSATNFEEESQLLLAHSHKPLIARRIFNTSYATTISLFSFQLPQQASESVADIDLANQALLGAFGLIVSFVFLVLPAVFTPARDPLLTDGARSSSSSSILDRLLDSSPIFNGDAKLLRNKIGLDSKKCLQRTICEAHYDKKNKRYGVLSLPFQIFFPPPSNESWKSHRFTPFNEAASYGHELVDSKNLDCGQKFKCFFNFLGLTSYCFNWYHQVLSNKA